MSADDLPGLEGVPIISEEVVLTDLSESQLIDYVSQAKDAHSRYFPEGREPLAQTDRAMILLAKNVTDEVFESFFCLSRHDTFWMKTRTCTFARSQVSAMAKSMLG
jgi:hypothetical protein